MSANEEGAMLPDLVSLGLLFIRTALVLHNTKVESGKSLQSMHCKRLTEEYGGNISNFDVDVGSAGDRNRLPTLQGCVFRN